MCIRDSVRTLWSWRNGHVDYVLGNSLTFRDQRFLSIAELPDALESVKMSEEAELLNEPQLPGSDVVPPRISTYVPIAATEGPGLIVACGPQTYDETNDHPVVGGDGDGVVYNSVEAMIDTCIEWVEQPDFDPFGGTPNEAEIWKKHNP